jgi:hypothetical protein
LIKLTDQPFSCVHCGKRFSRETTVINHICEPKRRALQRDEKRVQAGFMIFNRFFQLTQNAKKPKTYEEFCKTAYYNAFVKFGSFVNNVNPLYPDKFIDYVIKSGIKLDHWCKDELYEKYLSEILKTEPAEAAVQRSIETMIGWSDKNTAPYEHYFRYVNINRAVHDIKNGNISCWVILNSNSGKSMLSKFSDEQLDMVAVVLDVPYWLKKFKDAPSDVAFVKEVCQTIGI